LAKGSRVASATLLAAALSLHALPAPAASPADVATQRKETLDEILHTDTAYTVASERQLCAAGKMPAHISEQRAAGATFYPDAADMCVAALMRTAHDGRLSELYTKLLAQTGGDPSQVKGLPEAIGGAVLAHQNSAPIGNGKGMVVTPALAFDAGFAAADQDRGAKAQGTPNAVQLRGLAESCLAQQQSAGPCFSAGYMYGAQSVRGQISFAR
jgi:hypothetical protein